MEMKLDRSVLGLQVGIFELAFSPLTTSVQNDERPFDFALPMPTQYLLIPLRKKDIVLISVFIAALKYERQ